MSRYDKGHRLTRAVTVAQAIGKPCVRCGELMLEGQALHLDHADDGNGYLGYSHASCNARAGAISANKARAAAYRAAKAKEGQPPEPTVARAAGCVCRYPTEWPCGCGRHARVW